MQKGRSIELFFHNGNPDGMTTATIPFQWTGHVLVTSRTQLPEALKEEGSLELRAKGGEIYASDSALMLGLLRLPQHPARAARV